MISTLLNSKYLITYFEVTFFLLFDKIRLGVFEIMPILKVENLNKHYGKNETLVKALDNVTFSVNTGEFITIVGASGSGKSTLLHILGGVDIPTGGKVFIDEIDVYSQDDSKLSAFRRNKVGLIYQFYNLIPTLNIKENIELPVLLDNKEAPEEFLNELIKTLGLKDRMNHLPNQLSGGEQQRVAIARSLISKPAILLADEPTGNLDSKRSEEIIDFLKTVNKKYNQTIIMVTHDLELANKSKRIITLNDGKIVADELV